MSRLKSRKLIVGVLSAVFIAVNDAFGKPVSSEAIMQVVGILGVYILGQGIADHGYRRWISPVEDDGPNWDDTAKVDADADERRDLLG